jgi:hypothetical protein
MSRTKHRSSRASTVFILGAGFSTCAQLPVQADFPELLLSNEFNSEIDQIITSVLTKFLRDVFGWTNAGGFPTLEDVFTCIDLSANAGHTLGREYPPKRLRAIRRMAIYRIFSVLDSRFKESEDILKLLRGFCNPASATSLCSFIVLNWDIVLEKHLKKLRSDVSVDYCCTCFDWRNSLDGPSHAGIPVCKMHGSSNWVYCENCRSLFYDLDVKLSLKTKANLVASDFQLFEPKLKSDEFNRKLGTEPAERQCKFCGNDISTHIATFSYRKSFRTHAYPSIWYHAEKLLSESSRWVFIGYSLPESDYELKHLLKAAQLRMPHQLQKPREIVVVVKNDQLAREKFAKFFGSDLTQFVNGGLEEYVASV